MKKSLAIDQRLRRWLLPVMFALITALIATSLAIRIHGVKKHNLAVATEGVRNIFRMIVLTRQWNAEHGGVYVFASPETPVNEYLETPAKQIVLPDQRKLALLNPAYMTRQISELAEKDPHLNLRLHVTSVNPIRPANSPDSWEASALKQFEQGVPEFSSIEQQDDQYYLRYMAPLLVKEACLDCHAKQGYKLGEIRGGISVSILMQPIEQAMQREIRGSVISHAFFYGLSIAISWILIELLARRWRALDDNMALLQATRDELIEIEKMASLGRLVAGFAHELNTPVGVAVGAVSQGDVIIAKLKALITRDEVTEQDLAQQLNYLTESHQLALANLRRAADLVQRFKRTSIDRDSQLQREYQLAELIQDVLFTLQNSLKHTEIQIRVECPETIKIFGIPGLMEQILTNLITNSLQHGFENGTRPGQISISVHQDQKAGFRIDYQDNGIGMSEQTRSQAFEPFFTTSRERGGSGLGLYVTYTIVTKQMQGSIQLNRLPHGVRFLIECPLEQGIRP